ncbi:MAG: CHAT domain-containing protein, partial [Saprospiraceae bacterium]|nr:CHAT domain-containing protein [Saprospiraceae bacterium]
DAHYNISFAFLQKEDTDNALKHLDTALQQQLLVLDDFHVDIAYTLYATAVALFKAHRFEDAISYYQRALDAAKYEGMATIDKLEDAKVIMDIFKMESQCYMGYHRNYNNIKYLGLAQETAENSVEILKKMIVDKQDELGRKLLKEESISVYEAGINAYFVQELSSKSNLNQSNCFHFSELSKSLALHQNMKEAEALYFSNVPKDIIEIEQQLRLNIADMDKQQQQFLGAGLPETDTTVLKISSHLFDLHQKYDSLKLRLEKEYPTYYRLKYDLSTASLPYVQDTLLQPNQTLLEYFTGDSSTFVFLVKKDDYQVLEVKTERPLKEWVGQLQEGLYGYHTLPPGKQTEAAYQLSLKKYTEASRFLYEKLVAPLKEKLTGEVIIVPDGVLNSVPFEALLAEQPGNLARPHEWHYLLNDHDISYCYSATLLREMQQRQHRQQPKDELLAFAPYFDGDTSLLAGLFQFDETMRKDLQPLPYSGEEAFGAKKLMSGKAVVGKEATEDEFSKMAGDYRFLHLATHGQANRSAGDYSFLAFSEVKDSLENELLYVRDIYNLSLNADLVTLSACETGTGQLQQGEGIISLARAFAYAGAKSIVTTLWSVGDRHSKDLMLAFYKKLKKGLPKDGALRQAKLEFIVKNKGQIAHPFHWAGFIGIGDMAAVR